MWWCVDVTTTSVLLRLRSAKVDMGAVVVVVERKQPVSRMGVIPPLLIIVIAVAIWCLMWNLEGANY